MNKHTYWFIAGLVTAVFVAAASAAWPQYPDIPVAAGGNTETIVQGGVSYYQASFWAKVGFIENGGVYYIPDSPSQYDYETTISLTNANARWGSVGAALNTLSSEWATEYITQDFYSNAAFDSSW